MRGTGQRIPSDVSLWSGIPRSGEVDSHFGSDETSIGDAPTGRGTSLWSETPVAS